MLLDLLLIKEFCDLYTVKDMIIAKIEKLLDGEANLMINMKNKCLNKDLLSLY